MAARRDCQNMKERTARREESVREEGFGSDAGEVTPGSLGCCRLEKMEVDALKPPLSRVLYIKKDIFY